MNPTAPPLPTQQQPADLVNYFNDPRLATANANYQTATSAANESATGDVSLPAMLKQVLNDKFSTNNPMVQARQGALTDYLQSIPASQAAVLPENQGGTILSPIHQADLIAKMQSPKLAALSTINSLLGLQTGGIGDVIQQASAAHQANTQALTQKAGQARTNYEDILNELSKKADIALQERGQNLTAQRFSFDLAGGLKGIKSQQLVQDAQSGITLKDALQKYKGQLTPDEIFNTYNSSSKYGFAKESPSQLLKYGIKPPYTSDELARIDALKPAQAAIKSLTPDMINLAGPQNKGWNQFSINNLGGLGVDQRVVSANQTFQLMKQNVVRALQGARMSDQDIKMATQYIPQISDTPATVKTKLANLQKFIDSVNPQGNPSTPSSTGSWEVVSP